jgi:hypothetical protein
VGIRLEQGLANLYGDRLESKYAGFVGQEVMVNSEIYIYKTQRTTSAQMYLSSDTVL